MSLCSPCFHLENMNYLMIVTHQDYEGFKDEELDVLERRSGWGSLYMSDPQVLCMDSSDPQNPPRYIGRQNCEPLITEEFFFTAPQLATAARWQEDIPPPAKEQPCCQGQ